MHAASNMQDLDIKVHTSLQGLERKQKAIQDIEKELNETNKELQGPDQDTSSKIYDQETKIVLEEQLVVLFKTEQLLLTELFEMSGVSPAKLQETINCTEKKIESVERELTDTNNELRNSGLKADIKTFYQKTKIVLEEQLAVLFDTEKLVLTKLFEMSGVSPEKLQETINCTEQKIESVELELTDTNNELRNSGLKADIKTFYQKTKSVLQKKQLVLYNLYYAVKSLLKESHEISGNEDEKKAHSTNMKRKHIEHPYFKSDDDEGSLAKKLEIKQVLVDVKKPADTSVYCNSLEFLRPSHIGVNELSSYMEIGKLFRDAPNEEFTKIKQVLVDAKKAADTPFVFICSSSGTGKTQLPFSLDIPLLYFVYNIAQGTQNIYKAFNYESVFFKTLLLIDQMNFVSACGGQIGFSKSHVCNVLEQTKIKFKSYGFLVKFFEAVASNAQHSLEWMKAQLDVTAVNYQPLDIREMREQMKKFDPKPLIFLDEVIDLVVTPCHQMPWLDNEMKPALYFRFVKSVLRVANLVPVIMGTDTVADNFVKEDFTSNSRNDNVVWCHLIFKLPPIHTAHLTTQRNRILHKLQPLELEDSHRFNKLANLTAFLFRYLPKERPLITNLLVAKFEELVDDYFKLPQPRVDQNDPTSLATCDFLDLLLSHVFSQFIVIKNSRGLHTFFEGQLDFLNPRPNEGNRSSAFIHTHIAYLDLPTDSYNRNTNPVHIDLYVEQTPEKECSLNYKTVDSIHAVGSHSELTMMKSTLPRFNLEPLTGLCFSGPSRAKSITFPARDLSKSFTLYGVMLKLSRDSKNSSHENHFKSTLDGDKLEYLAARALVLASHANGFQGHANFRSFFPHFLLELQKSYQVYEVDFETRHDIWEVLDTQRIPYCSTVTGVNPETGGPLQAWDEDVYQYFTQELQCTLGQVVETKHADAVDVEMYHGYHRDYSQMIAVECRLHANPSGSSDISYKAKTFLGANKTAKFFIIIVAHWANINVTKLGEKIVEGKFWTIQLVRTNNEPNYTFETLYMPEQVERVCILIDLKTTTQTPVSDEEETFCCNFKEELRESFSR